MHNKDMEVTKGGSLMVKRGFVLALLAVSMVFAMTATAFANPGDAKPNTYTEAGGVGVAGGSAWTYKDNSDSVAKTEGSYNTFEATATAPANNAGLGIYTTNPHGGYSTTSNKCKTCHAVHRANGAFALMRVDNVDDACNYCHIGSHRHASKEAYFGGSNGIYSSNGHTIGSGKEIPDSSIWQWTENVTLTSAEGDTAQVPVRRYLTQKNKIFRYIVHGNRWIRVGPNNLRCASCHQVHNATRQIWTPQSSGYMKDANGVTIPAGTELVGGYKLLRNSPSGGIAVHANDAAILNSGSTAVVGTRALSKVNFTYWDPGYALNANTNGNTRDGLAAATDDYRIRALETTIALSTGLSDTGAVIQGPNVTGYTPFKYFAPTNTPAETVANMPVYETSLSFWCADCHNLNIAGKSLAAGFGTSRGGDGMLGDRSHAVPSQMRAGTVTVSGTHCTQCHNSDMPLDGSSRFAGSDCGACHVTVQMYSYYKNGGTNQNGQTWAQAAAAGELPRVKGVQLTATAARSDFPHSGPDWSKKLLNARDRRVNTGQANQTATNPWLEVGGPGVTQVTENGFNFRYDTQGSAIDFAAGDGQDKVCKTCHGGIKNREIGYDK